MAYKVFLSQPMNGRSGDTIEKIRNDAEAWVKVMFGMEAVLMKPAAYMAGMKPIETLGESIKMIADADVVIFARGWETARGCRIEHDVCLFYGKGFYEL